MQMVKGYQMIGLYAACYREESEFFLRPWSDIFWEVEQRADYQVLRESMSEEKWEQLEHFFKGSHGGKWKIRCTELSGHGAGSD